MSKTKEILNRMSEYYPYAAARIETMKSEYKRTPDYKASPAIRKEMLTYLLALYEVGIISVIEKRLLFSYMTL